MRQAAATAGRRAAGYFLAPREQPPAAEVTRLVPRDQAGARPVTAPAPPPPRPAAATAPPAVRLPPRVAVLGRRAEAVPVAVAVANALRAQHGAPSAALAVWSPSPGAAALSVADTAQSRPPASPAAHRLAARLTTRGLAAQARGRLAWLELDEHPVAAALAVRRVSGAVDVPVVTVLAGPRTAVLEGLLREQDLVVVVARDPGGALARLAVATSEVPAVACPPLPVGPARLLAAAGLAGARVLDARAMAAIERLGEPVPYALRTRR